MALTVRERGVLFGLVRWPESTDAELAVDLGLNRTTVTVIRQRLLKRGLVRSVLSLISGVLAVSC